MRSSMPARRSAACTVEGRLTLCNLSIEMGAQASAWSRPTTRPTSILARPRLRAQGRDVGPRRRALAHPAVRSRRRVRPRAHDRHGQGGAADHLGHQPRARDRRRPGDPRSRQGTARTSAAAWTAALQYQGLEPGKPIEGTKVDWVFIGSCTNSRISDLRAAAAIAKGRQKAAHVNAWVVPGSERVKREAEAEGLDRVFKDAGFEWREPGCSMCIASNGERVPPGQRSVSTSNRNFVGRQGPGARTHLASPAMAAAAAIKGAIADVRQAVISSAARSEPQWTQLHQGDSLDQASPAPADAPERRHRPHHPDRAAGQQHRPPGARPLLLRADPLQAGRQRKPRLRVQPGALSRRADHPGGREFRLRLVAARARCGRWPAWA